VDSFGGAVWCLSANYEKTHLAVSIQTIASISGEKYASRDIFPQTVSVLKNKQFSKNIAQGKL